MTERTRQQHWEGRVSLWSLAVGVVYLAGFGLVEGCGYDPLFTYRCACGGALLWCTFVSAVSFWYDHDVKTSSILAVTGALLPLIIGMTLLAGYRGLL